MYAYRDNKSSGSESEDSDDECTVWKRATHKRTHTDEILKEMEEIKNTELPVEVKEEPAPAKRQRKKNTIWSEVLEDQLISEDLEDCFLKNKPRNYGSRGKESYDYTLRYSETRSEKDSDSHMSENDLNEEPSKPKSKHTSSFHNNAKKFVKLDSAELTAARKINKILNEKKFYLIQRIVKTVGIEKSMHLLNMTEEIEDNGGMMINNKSRRRTPGGVFIQLLKSDKSVTQEMLDKIFEGEMSAIELKKFYAERKKNKKKLKQKRGKKQKSNGNSGLLSEVPGSNEIVCMDAEITTDDVNIQNKTLESEPTPISNTGKSISENMSDLEEGEIED